MKYYINGRFLNQKITGVQRFASEISKNFDFDFDFLSPTNSGFSGHSWEQVLLPFLSADRVLINLCNTAPVFRHEQLVVLHDIAFIDCPENFTVNFRRWYGLMTSLYIKKAKKIVTVSKFSAARIANYFNYPISKIDVVGESGEHVLKVHQDLSILDKNFLDTGKYFLLVGSSASNKNIARAVDAFFHANLDGARLVIVGPKCDAVFGKFNFSDSKNISHLGYVSDSELKALYANAAAYIFPSLYEGFGIPPLEAMASGCPVLASNAASIPEVCKDSALYFDPFDILDMSRVFRKIWQSKSLQLELIESGFLCSSEWTWAEAGACFSNVVRSIK